MLEMAILIWHTNVGKVLYIPMLEKQLGIPLLVNQQSTLVTLFSHSNIGKFITNIGKAILIYQYWQIDHQYW